MKARVADVPSSPISGNRVKHETPWVCWRAAGGCGHVAGMNFGGGACPACGVFAVTRVVLVAPEEDAATGRQA